MNIVVTGAGRGIGHLLASSLAASNMYLLYHSDSDGINTIKKPKSALNALKCDVSCDLAIELIRNGIFVNCIGANLREKIRQATLQPILSHFGDPLEIVRAVEFIIGSKYLVGSTIN